MMERTLQVNGTTLYTFTNEKLHSFCISVYTKAGSIFEAVDDNGITHLLEHVIFRNMNQKYGGKLYDLLAMNGLSFSGSTYKEFLYFSVEGPSAGFIFACEVLFSIFDKISVDIQELNHEKKRIKAEIREKDERHSMRYLFSKRIWKGTNGDKTILGTCKVLDRTSRKALEEHRRKIFSAGNCFVYVTGCITEENVLYLTEKIKQLDIADSALSRTNTIHPTGSFFNRDGAVAVKDSTYCSVYIGFDTDTRKYSAGVLDLIYQILFSGDNALLFQHISENSPLVYSYDSTHEQYDNIGCFFFDFDITPDLMEESISRVVDALCDLKQGRFHFEANLNYELANWILLQDNPKDLNWNLAYANHILDTAPVVYASDKLGRFSSVTKEAIIEAAKNIFTRTNLTLLLEGKKNKINTENIAIIIERLDQPR